LIDTVSLIDTGPLIDTVSQIGAVSQIDEQKRGWSGISGISSQGALERLPASLAQEGVQSQVARLAPSSSFKD
jgi:hypothetical protein